MGLGSGLLKKSPQQPLLKMSTLKASYESLLPATGDQALRPPEGEPPQAGLHKLALKMSSSQASSETLLLPPYGDQTLRLPEEESLPAGTEDVFLPAKGAHANLNLPRYRREGGRPALCGHGKEAG